MLRQVTRERINHKFDKANSRLNAAWQFEGLLYLQILHHQLWIEQGNLRVPSSVLIGFRLYAEIHTKKQPLPHVTVLIQVSIHG